MPLPGCLIAMQLRSSYNQRNLFALVTTHSMNGLEERVPTTRSFDTSPTGITSMWNSMRQRWKTWAQAVFRTDQVQPSSTIQAKTATAPDLSQPPSDNSKSVRIPDGSELPFAASTVAPEGKTICRTYVKKYKLGSGDNRINICIYEEPITESKKPESTKEQISPSCFSEGIYEVPHN